MAGACSDAGDGNIASGTSAVAPFGSPGSQAPGAEQPSSPAGTENQQPTPDGASQQPSENSNPEATPGDITLNPGMTGGTDTNGGTTPPDTSQPPPPDMTNPGMTPPDTTPPEEQPPAPPPPTLERPTRGTPNLFTDLLDIPVGEVDAKLTTAVNRLFGIGTNEPATPTRDTGFRVYYELPQDRSMAFMWTTDSDDIRSEGQSYGMMIAVQMDMQDQFNRLWKFAKTFMQFPNNAQQTSWRFNFRWQGTVNRNNANNWQINFPQNTGPAPDGDEYFAAALYLADRRWGSNGGVNYQQEADNIAHAMISNPAAGGNTPLINAQNNLVVFFPAGNSANFTDPSYNLPAFYEIFAQDGPGGDANRWNAIADASRRLIVNSAHPATGLHPDYSNFNGSPNNGGSNHDQFRFDAWRVIMNLAVDYAWSGQNANFTTVANRYHAFFGTQLNADKDNVVNQNYNLDGSNASGGNSTALTSTLGAGAIASTAPNRLDFVNAAWNVYQQSGQYRYYQETVYILGLLATSGMMGYEWNGAAP